MTILYGINNCDTIKKTKKWLEEHEVDFEFHDYKKLGCSKQLAQQFLREFDLKEVINTRGTTWRKLPENVKGGLDLKSAPSLMQEQPSIIKRPILEIDGTWVIGFDADQLAELTR